MLYPIQAAECIEGICSKPLSAVNEAFILLISLTHRPSGLDWPFRDSKLLEGPRGSVTQPRMSLIRVGPSGSEQTTTVADSGPMRQRMWGRRVNVCQNYIHRKAQLFQSFTRYQWATLV